MKTMTLVLLPGLDGTEVFFKPLLASLPHWIHPRVVCLPFRRQQLCGLARNRARSAIRLSKLLRARVVVCRAAGAHAGGGRT